jgi:Uma2 family endonuclease
MALTIGDRPLHALTVDDVWRMVEVGILTEDDRVELLEGALVEMSPKSPEHEGIITLVTRWLNPLLAAGTHDLRTGATLAVPDPRSLPEPDLAVVERLADPRVHPTSALLVVEVSVSSLLTDTRVKPALYAAAGVPDYWVVDVPHQRLEIRREPVGTEYRRLQVLGPDEQAAALALDLPPLDLGELLAAR